MFSHVFLAVTAGELREFSPGKIAYMACHFSPYGKGLTNLPSALPKDSLLLLDDSMQPNGHDPDLVIRQLQSLIGQFSVKAVLLDFQNKEIEETTNMAARIMQALPCPVAATAPYAKESHSSVFLPPPPPNISLPSYIAPWKQQGIFLELAPEPIQITVTDAGSVCRKLNCNDRRLPLHDERLHCHYSISLSPGQVTFTLMRTGEDLSALAHEAEQLGVSGTVGLYQELRNLQQKTPQA